MTPAITPTEMRIIVDIVTKHLPRASVYAFGSRTSDDHYPASDLDLAIDNQEKINFITLGSIQEDFMESDIPYSVDVLDYHSVSDHFRAIINTHKVPLLLAEQFGNADIVDELTNLILAGKKTATCSLLKCYELENVPLPIVGMYTTVLDGTNKPVALIKTTHITYPKMNEVTQALAALEGEGDLSLAYWYDGHFRYFTEELKAHGLNFDDNMTLVFEQFEVQY